MDEEDILRKDYLKEDGGDELNLIDSSEDPSSDRVMADPIPLVKVSVVLDSPSNDTFPKMLKVKESNESKDSFQTNDTIVPEGLEAKEENAKDNNVATTNKDLESSGDVEVQNRLKHVKCPKDMSETILTWHNEVRKDHTADPLELSSIVS